MSTYNYPLLLEKLPLIRRNLDIIDTLTFFVHRASASNEICRLQRARAIESIKPMALRLRVNPSYRYTEGKGTERPQEAANGGSNKSA